MDRRTTLAALFGKPFAGGTGNLMPYRDSWTCELAAHLLRRTTFGPSYEQIKYVTGLGLDATVDLLFQDLPLPNPPINYYDNDPIVPVGKTWINSLYHDSNKKSIIDTRHKSLKGWTMSLIIDEGISIREKLTLFWHNHFAVGNIEDPRFSYQYITSIRSQAWGNFRELVKTITIDPAMLRFLNGYQNTATAPNENYARELLELFTIGKGSLVGPGDYTNYTEEDVVQIARVLTGWKVSGYLTTSKREKIGASYHSNFHDKGTKQLSIRLGGTSIQNSGEEEYAYLIDVIFRQEEVARFICRKLYRWFVYYEIDDQVEVHIIEPLAQLLINNDFEIKPVLKTLLKSTHFYEERNIGVMIKNPIDFFMSVAKTTRIAFPTEQILHYRIMYPIYRMMEFMQMDYFNPPDVAGWKAYYQEPLYYRIWINSANLPIRAGIADRMAVVGQTLFGFQMIMDVLAFINTFDNPADPNQVIEEMSQIFFPFSLPQIQRDALKDILVSGLPDDEWTKAYRKYIANPNDLEQTKTVERKLRLLLKKIIGLPEFNLS